MNYLHEQRIIHGDLSARNVLVKDIDHVEVSDFGFANMLKGNKPINSELVKKLSFIIKNFHFRFHLVGVLQNAF
jgi:serine/threonine protein kinase